jgi:hypothetical protein
MKRTFLLTILLLLCLIQACENQIPETAKDLAISALCDFPAFSGHNRCQSVSITNVMVENSLLSNNKPESNLKKWCIELSYIDYIGDQGHACVWLVGPSKEGEYSLSKGPLLDARCVGTQ